MVKSYEKKEMSKLFSYDSVVKCRRNLNFEKMMSGVWWEIFKKYLKQNIIMEC